MSGGVLLEESLIKRSQQKKRTSPLNYKHRLFVLTRARLSYYEGKAEKKNRKGYVELSRVRCVEMVKHGDGVVPCQNKYPFQVVYDSCILYVFAASHASRTLWVQTLKDEIRNNLVIEAKFHPQFWLEGVWLCCRQGDKLAPGCEEYNLFGDISRKPLPPIPGEEKGRRAPPLPPGEAGGADGGLEGDDEDGADDDEEEEEVVVALYDFSRAEPHDLALVRGEEYAVLERGNTHWYKARNAQGEVGYIPSNYVTEKTSDNLERFAWYSKQVNRNRAEDLLRREDTEGGFIVRDSSKPGAYTVSLYAKAGEGGATVKHYHIKLHPQSSPPLFYLAEKHLFSSIPELIHYHQHNSAGLVTRLRYPVGEQGRSAPSTAGFSYDKWEMDPSELTLMKELGSGQFGVVRLGRWRAGPRVAVKTIREGAMDQDDFIEEARVMMRLSHPKLVQLYGVCTHQTPIFIVTEFMELGCLLNYIRQRRGGFSTGSLLSMCLDVCEGMEHLERHGFIHRDLAARNCLVNEALVVKVSDFGMARYVLDNQYTSSSGSRFPVKWSPPEVFNFCKYSSKSDVWSYGVLMWEVFSEGSTPFEQRSNQQVVQLVTQGKRLYRPNMAPAAVYHAMQLCWSQRPEERPSFFQMSQMISSVLEEDGPVV